MGPTDQLPNRGRRRRGCRGCLLPLLVAVGLVVSLVYFRADLANWASRAGPLTSATSAPGLLPGVAPVPLPGVPPTPAPTLDAETTTVVRILNDHRSAERQCDGGTAPAAPPLRVDPQVQLAASRLAADLASGKVDDPWKEPVEDRIFAAGYPVTDTFAYARFGGTDAAVAARKSLDGSGCRKASDPALEAVGVGHAVQPGSEYTHYWVILAAARQEPNATAEVLRLTNEARGKPQKCGDESFPPQPPLEPDAALERAAAGHALDMAQQGYFAHESRDGRRARDRIRAAGFSGETTGENIAKGQVTAREVVDGWMASPGHCKNIMYPDFTKLGVGVAYQTTGRERLHWVQNFGG